MPDIELAPHNGLKTVEKSLRILELLLREKEGMSIAQLAQRTGLHRASVHRLLTSLHALGWIERPAARPHFRISLRLYALARVFVQGYNVVERLDPLLVELCQRSRETVHLGILDNWDVVHISRQESPERVGVSSRIGGRGWAHTSSMGKALLAEQSNAYLQAYIEQTGLPRLTEHTITTPEAFWAEIQMTRQRRYAIDDEEDSIGVRCLGTAIPSTHGPAVLGVSITGPSPRFTLETAHQFAPILLDLVQNSSASGFIPEEVAVSS
jgi:IclR family acetate operon transcriptional repressor